ncbi:hypothetical protein VNI00_013747 [Paramarasmius palmivorus]|uniref:F-box domain-containing protein n=1 Tax=Paramarasmius palmivorus TaxID=297713 RepID=A0AAW0BY43_9AGAR
MIGAQAHKTGNRDGARATLASKLRPSLPLRKIIMEELGKEATLPGAFCYTQEVPVLEPLLEEVEQRLYSYDSKLERLRDALGRLEKQREILWSLKERLRGLVRPFIQRLPPEILLNIFSLCEGQGPSQCHTSLALSHVCARWRSLIFSESSLWTDIVMNVGPHDNHDAVLAFTRLCLEKSKRKSLYVDLDTSNNSGYKGYPYYREVFQSSTRWKHATLRLHPQDLEDLELAASMPYLEVLQIQGDTQPYSDFFDTDDDLDTNRIQTHSKIFTPRLRELSTMGKVDGSLFLQLDTSSLVLFSTEESDMDIILDVLGKSPKLEEVDLWSPTYRLGLFHDPGSRLITSNIRSLEMQCGCSSVHLFKRLHLPSLTYLKLFGDWEFNESDSEMDIDNSSSVVELLRRSRPPLEMLQLQSLSFSSDELEMIMEACPSITRFHLTDCCKTRDPDRRVVTDMLVKSLTLGADGKAFGTGGYDGRDGEVKEE